MAQAPDERRIKPLYIVLGAVLGVVVVAFVLVNFVLFDDDPVTFDDPPVAAPATPEPTPMPTPTPDPEEIEVFEIFEGRDPFRPLVFPQPPAPDPTPIPPDATPAPNGPAPPPPEPTPVPPRPGVQVEVMFVAEDNSHATVRVGAQVHENARPGDTLSSDVVVRSISGGCVFFERRGESFRLCEGEAVRK